MSIRGRWQVVETPGYEMALAGAYILFNEAGGEFAFDCLTGSIHGAFSKGRSAFSTVTTSHSSRAVQRLLQQPAKAP
jgi:hypothetical protein